MAASDPITAALNIGSQLIERWFPDPVQRAEATLKLEQMRQSGELEQMTWEFKDRADARANNSNRDAVWWIAVCILVTFAVIMGFVLAGCYALITGGIGMRDPSVVAAVSGLVGSVVGYVASNAQTVVNFIFGGSLGSEKKTDALSTGIQQAINAVRPPN